MSHELFSKYEISRRRTGKIRFRPKPWTQPILNLILISKPIWKLKFIDNHNHWIMTYWLILVVGWDLVTLTVYKGFFHIQKPHKSEISNPLISNLSLSHEIQIFRIIAKALRRFLRVFSLSFTFVFNIVRGIIIIYQVYEEFLWFQINSW